MKERVLFLCTGNSARSQMAEAILRVYGGGRFEVHSAGLSPRPINHLAVEAMQEMGIDISSQKSKDVKTYLGNVRFNYVVTLCHEAEQQCPHLFVGALHSKRQIATTLRLVRQ